MRNTLISLLALAATALTGTSAAAQNVTQRAVERGEAKFAELTEGRTAGTPRSCISAIRPQDVDVIENVGISYRQGDTLWIARAADPRSLSRNDVPIIDRFGTRLCKQDMIRTVDRFAGFVTGTVFLGDFVPYTRAEQG